MRLTLGCEVSRRDDALSFLADAGAKILMHDLNGVRDTLLLEDTVDLGSERLVKALGHLNVDVGVGTGRVCPNVQVIIANESIEPSGAVASRDTEDLDTVVAHRMIMNGHGDGGQHHGEESEDTREQHFAEDWVRCRSRRGQGRQRS